MSKRKRSLSTQLIVRTHEVTTIYELGWGTLQNGSLISQAEAAGIVKVSHIQRTPPMFFKRLFRRHFWNARGASSDIGKSAAIPLVKVTGDSNQLDSKEAAVALDRSGNPQTLPDLTKMLKNSEPAARIAAAEGLGDISDAHAIEALRSALLDEQHEVRMAATKALRKMAWKPETIEERAIFAVAKEARDIISDNGLDEAIALGGAAVEPLIVALRTFPLYAAGRQYAARALGEIGDARAREPLKEALSSKDSNLKNAARIALEKIEHRWSPIPLAMRVMGKKDSQPTQADRKKDRFGKCVTCGAIVELTDSKEICQDWDGVDAYFYYCQTCYRSDSRYQGRLLDRYGQNLIDQYRE